MGAMNERKGFTMVELVAVLTIGLVLTAMTIGTAMGMKNFYSRRETVKELKDIGCALLRYQMDMDHFPTGEDREGLRRLWTAQGTQEWTGPYNSPDEENAVRDGWHNGYIYRHGRNASGTEIALVLSPGRNGVVDSNLTNWTLDAWRESGDDIAWKISESWNVKDKEGFTQVNLRSEAGRLTAAHPLRAPDTYTPTLPDAFEQPLHYVRCNENAAFLLSLGGNGRNDSNLCGNGSAGGDDIVVSVEWSPNTAPQVLTPPPPRPPRELPGVDRPQRPPREPPPPPRDPCP